MSIILPKNITEVIQGNLEGYKLKYAYSLKLTHGLMGYFPAISAFGEERKIIFTDDLSLLTDIWKILPPRPSAIERRLYYSNEEAGLNFEICFEYYSTDLKKIESDSFLNRESFIKLLQTDGHKFTWASGLLGPDWSHEQMLREIDSAIKELAA